MNYLTPFNSKEELYNEVVKRTGIEPVCLYMYGSRVYGNYQKDSDFDFIAIVEKCEPGAQFSDNLINVNFYTITEHQQRLDDHEPSALECHFLGEDFILKEKYLFIRFKLDLVKLRHAVSAKSSNSWVKAKKKLTVEKDYNDRVGKKSLWHAMRLVDFGIQIASKGEIENYASFNEEFLPIMRCYDWEDMYDTYKKKYNEMCTEFRKLAPKE
jgi:hypothetical protein